MHHESKKYRNRGEWRLCVDSRVDSFEEWSLCKSSCFIHRIIKFYMQIEESRVDMIIERNHSFFNRLFVTSKGGYSWWIEKYRSRGVFAVSAIDIRKHFKWVLFFSSFLNDEFLLNRIDQLLKREISRLRNIFYFYCCVNDKLKLLLQIISLAISIDRVTIRHVIQRSE